MLHLVEYKADLARLAGMACAMAMNWLGIRLLILSVDIIPLAAIIVGGLPMFAEAFAAVRNRRMSMELSMAIAVIAACLIGQFLTALIISFFVLVAELLEHLTVVRGRSVIKELVELLPHQATIRRQDRETEIDIQEIAIGDVVVVKPAARIPVDGIILIGNSTVDQSSLTGESLPVDKVAGQSVFAGTINQTGVLEIRPTSIGRDTTFGKIIAIIEQAEKSRAPIQRVADTLAARLVYFAFAGALATYIYTRNIESAIAALVVAGACGVAAGTPLAILAGIGRTAKEGIITKGGIALEQLANVDTVVLDKTGTLTFGAPVVVDVHGFRDSHSDEVLRLAAIAEQYSEHPLAQAILAKARASGVQFLAATTREYLPGQGLISTIEDDGILVGNVSLLKNQSIPIDAEVVDYLKKRKDSGETIVFIAKKNVVIGVISLADVLRAEAKQAVAGLQQFGCQVILLTGDNWDTARSIGNNLRVNDVFAEMLPQQKLEVIKGLKSQGKIVAMIGDGINDAPALMEAHVGIAMGTGTDVAMECAALTLITNNLMKIIEAIKISKQSLRVIKFNFWGTVVVDCVGMCFAFTGNLTPLLAAFVHVGSELAFILNSARLFRK